MSYQPSPFKQLFHRTRRFLAKNWLSHQKALQIAITGSQGKTITAQTLFKILSKIGPTTVTDVNLDTIYNVPITALTVFRWTKFAIFELGVDKPGEMDLHLQIVQPKISVITGISPVHTDTQHLASLGALIKEKRKLIAALPKDGYAILNWDDENVRKMALYTKAKVLWYGTDKKKCDIWADNVTISLAGTDFFMNNKKIHTSLIGKHHIYTIMAAYAVLKAIQKLAPPTINLPANLTDQLIEVVKNIKPLPGRMSLEAGPRKTVVLNDSLRANPASTASGLQTLSAIDYKKGRKIAVLAEMGELQHPKEEHQKIIELLKKLDIDYVIAIGNLYPVSSRSLHAENVQEAANILKKMIKKDDLIYLKGSLLRHVERVLLILEGKRVGCNVLTCPFYWHCLKCRYLEVGYQK